MKMGVSCKTLHIKSAMHSPRVYVIPEVTLQIGKQCKPVQVHSFSRFSPLGQSSQIACWGKHPQAPLNGICDTDCTIFQSFCKKQSFSFSSLQQKSDDRKITQWGTPTFSGIAAIITLLSATNRSVARSCHLSQGEVVHRKLCRTPRSSR